MFFFFFSSRRRHTRFDCDWSSDVCSSDLRELVKRFLDMMPARIDEYEELLTNNRIWHGRLKGVGYLPAETLIAMSTTGPGLRAAGVAFDNRKAFPYSSYEEFDFNVVT